MQNIFRSVYLIFRAEKSCDRNILQYNLILSSIYRETYVLNLALGLSPFTFISIFSVTLWYLSWKMSTQVTSDLNPDGYILFKTLQDEETIRTEVGVHMLIDREPDFFLFFFNSRHCNFLCATVKFSGSLPLIFLSFRH